MTQLAKIYGKWKGANGKREKIPSRKGFKKGGFFRGIFFPN